MKLYVGRINASPKERRGWKEEPEEPNVSNGTTEVPQPQLRPLDETAFFFKNFNAEVFILELPTFAAFPCLIFENCFQFDCWKMRLENFKLLFQVLLGNLRGH